MKSYWIIGVLLLPGILAAQGWKENFDELITSQKPANGKWIIGSGDLTMARNNRSFELVRLKGTPVASKYIPYDFTGPVRYLQIRVIECTARVLPGTGFGPLLDWIRFQPGLYTIPVYECTRPELKNKPMKGSMAFSLRLLSGKLRFSELALTDNMAADGVFFTVTGADGKVKDSRTAAVAGDTVTIEMQVKDKPDNLSLYLYRINDENNWAYRGRFESVTLPGVPIELKESEIPNRYRASFKLQKLPKALKLKGGKLIAAVNYLGADSNNRGYYYGICANPIELEGGMSPAAGTADSSLQVFDFGPASGAAAPDALAVDRNTKHRSFSWLRKPAGCQNGFRKTLDPLMMDWAEIKPNTFAEMEITVKPGKYKVTVGTGGANTMCWLHQFCRPLRAEILINGKKQWHFDEQDETRFALMERESRVSDDLFEVYMAPHLKDLTAEADCPDGKLRIRIAAGPKTSVPLNYAAVYRADDEAAEAKLKRMQAARRQVFKEFWRDVTPSEKALFRALSLKDYERNGRDFAVFARHNPYEYVYLKTRPLASEAKAPLRILTAPGEYAAGAALLHTFAPLKKAGVKLDLPDFPGATVSFIMPFRFASYTTRSHFIAPNHYVPMGNRDLEADMSYGFRVGFKTPENLKSGVYRGKLVFSGNGQTVQLPVEIRVTGEKLPELSDHLIAMLGINSAGEELYNAMVFSKEELGCNTAVFMFGWPRHSKFKTDKDGSPVEWIRDRDQLRKWFEYYKKAGFPVKTPFVSLMSAPSRLEHYRQGPFRLHTKNYEKAAVLQYALLRDMAVQYGGCTGIVADLGGEMGHGTNFPKQEVMDAAKEVFRIVGNIPGVKASYRCNCSETTRQFYDHLQIQGVRDPGSWPVSDRQSNFGKNKHIYTYSVEGRFRNGLHSWAHGARGNLREWLVFKHQVEYNEFLSCCGYCGGTFHFEAMPAPGGKLLPTVRSDAFRASVIDRQYLRMLENAVRSSGHAAAKASAEAFLSILRNRALSWKEPGGGIIWMAANNPWPGIRLDLMREAIVLLCGELKTGRKVLPEFSPLPLPAGQGIPAEPENEAVMKDFAAMQKFPYKHWRDIRTGDGWEKQGLPYDGCAWYRKKLRIPADWDNPVLRIGAADEQAWVFCNGKFLGHHNGWNSAFSMELSGVRGGTEAEIAVMVYDSMNMGGIWRSVTLHKNAGDAGKNRNGIDLNAGWKIALRPFGRKLDTFELVDGPLVPDDAQQTEAQVLLVPDDFARLQDLAESESQVVICDLKGKELYRQNLGKITPYDMKKFVLPLQGIREKVCDAVLLTAGRESARFRFYRIPRWQPE